MDSQNDSTIECPKCRAANPEANQYCGQCGTALAPALQKLRDQVDGIIRERLRDQKVVEIETAQAVAARVMGWTKNLAFFVGIPLALLVAALTVWGIKSFNDFQRAIETKQSEVIHALEDEKKNQLTAINEKSEALQRDLEIQVASNPVIKKLEEKVDAIGAAVGFVPSKALTPEVQASVQRTLAQFVEYLRTIGHDSSKTAITVEITSDPSKLYGAIALYWPAPKQLMVVDAKYANEQDVILREFMQHILLGIEGRVGSSGLASLESGLASYFPCSFKGNPRYAPTVFKDPKWTLKHDRKITELDLAPEKGFDWPWVWGGVLWELRENLGQENTDRLLLKTWSTLSHQPNLTGQQLVGKFASTLLDIDQKNAAGQHSEQIKKVLRNRGFDLPDLS